jgi:hypothetical protein
MKGWLCSTSLAVIVASSGIARPQPASDPAEPGPPTTTPDPATPEPPAATTLPPATAPAEAASDDREEARALLAARRYDAALAALDRAERRAPSPEGRYDMGFIEERRGRLLEAREHYRRALKLARARKDQRLERALRTALAKLERRIPFLELVIKGGLPRGAAVRIDGGPTQPGSRRLRVNPGRHVVESKVPGLKARRTVVDVGESERVRFELAFGPDESTPRGGVDLELVFGITSLGVGVGLAATAIYASVRIGQLADDEAVVGYQNALPEGLDACAEAGAGRVVDGAPDPGQVADRCEAVDDMEIVRGVTLPLALLGAGAGLLLIITSDTVGGGESARIHVTPFVGPATAGMRATASF